MPLLSAVALGIMSGVLALTWSIEAAIPVSLTVVLALVLTAFRTSIPGRLIHALVRSAEKPSIQAAAILAFGAGILAWQVWALKHELEQELSEADRHMAALVMPDLKPLEQYVSLTDQGAVIPLWQMVDGMSDEEEAERYLRQSKYEMKLIQTDGPDPRYNCHGWVFTGGKAWIRGSNVDQILREHEYVVVTNPSPGDIAVYRNDSGEVTHTALVRGRGENGTLILESKWGKLGRYIHTHDQHAYSVYACTFYSTARASHLLNTELAAVHAASN